MERPANPPQAIKNYPRKKSHGYHPECPLPQQLKPMAGRRFGRLTVLHHDRAERRGSFWAARCDCGAAGIVSGSDVRAGRVRSCGCRGAEHRAAWPAAWAALRRQRIRDQKELPSIET